MDGGINLLVEKDISFKCNDRSNAQKGKGYGWSAFWLRDFANQISD